MAMVKFESLNKTTKTVVMNVDGVNVTRNIADNITDADKYIKALALGLATENPVNPVLESTTYKKGEVIVDTTETPEVIK